jgi:hypothetical protein
MSNGKLGRFGRLYDLKINCKFDVDRLVKLSQFGWKDERITSAHFPIEGKDVREVEVEFYEFDRTVTGEEAAAQIEADGYVNEDVRTLLNFGMLYPLEQLRRPITVFGSRWQDADDIWNGVGLYTIDSVDRGERGLYLFRPSYNFRPLYRFLVSRKQEV